jgi:hypothetical protein
MNTAHTIARIQEALDATGMISETNADAETISHIYSARNALHLALAAVQGPYSHLEGH